MLRERRKEEETTTIKPKCIQESLKVMTTLMFINTEIANVLLHVLYKIGIATIYKCNTI